MSGKRIHDCKCVNSALRRNEAITVKVFSTTVEFEEKTDKAVCVRERDVRTVVVDERMRRGKDGEREGERKGRRGSVG